MADQPGNVDFEGIENDIQNALQLLENDDYRNDLQLLNEIQINLVRSLTRLITGRGLDNDHLREPIRIVTNTLVNLADIANDLRNTAANTQAATPVSFRRRATNAVVSKLASLFAALENFVQELSRRPPFSGPVHKFFFPPPPRVYQIDQGVSTEPEDECFICKEPFIPTTYGSHLKGLSFKGLFLNAAPQEVGCRPVKLRPCGHVVGDVCIAAWMQASNPSSGGRCPYCRQQIGYKPLSLFGKVKAYFSASVIFHVPDMLAGMYMIPSMRRTVPMLTWVMFGAGLSSYACLWTRCMVLCLQTLWRGNIPIVAVVYHCAVFWALLFVPFIAAVMDLELLRVLQLVVTGIRRLVDWYNRVPNVA